MRQPGEDAVRVALFTGSRLMSAGQRKAIVSKTGSHPRDGRVTAFAGPCPALGDMIGVLSRLHAIAMAGFAAYGCAQEIADLSAGMAAKTGCGGVAANERKSSSLMAFDLFARLPILLLVTLLATTT